jgi:hypothetical protein
LILFCDVYISLAIWSYGLQQRSQKPHLCCFRPLFVPIFQHSALPPLSNATNNSIKLFRIREEKENKIMKMDWKK